MTPREPTPVLRLRGRVLVEADELRDEVWVVGGRFTFDAPTRAHDVTTIDGWVLPGLVDAHSHVGLDAGGAVAPELTAAQASADRDAGTLLIRDAGQPGDTRWVDEREDLPVVVRAGRHIARTRRYIRGYAHEVEPEDLAATVRAEAAQGDGWVKLVGDWIDRDSGDLGPCWPADCLREAIQAAHDVGVRVTAHCFGEDCLPDLLGAGIDCIEHATGLTDVTTAKAAAAGVPIVPTLVNIANFPAFAAAGESRFPAYAARMRRLFDRRYTTMGEAYEAGVAIFVGTDAGEASRTGWSPGRSLSSSEPACRRPRPWTPPAGARARGCAARAWWRARRPTPSSTTTTPGSMSTSSATRGRSCCAAGRCRRWRGRDGGDDDGREGDCDGSQEGREPVTATGSLREALPDDGPRLRRARRRVGRATESVAVLATGSMLAVAASWPQVQTVRTTAPGNLGDPLYFAWQLAWVGHAVGSDPAGLWTTNAFQQAPDNLAFTDTILGYAPLSLVTGSGQPGALAQLNIAGLLATALAFAGAYALARVLGAGVAGSLVAGAGFGFAPWRLEQVIHLNVVSTGGAALALALLLRGHGWSLRSGWQPGAMGAWWVGAGWLAACWQLSLGLAIGIPFTYVLGVVGGALVVGWVLRGRRVLGWRALPRAVVVADAAGAAAFALTGWLIAAPHLRVLHAHPEGARPQAALDLFSPPVRGLFTAPESDVWWGRRQASWRTGMTWVPEMVLSPGFVLTGLAVLGLFVSVWPLRRRLTVLGLTVCAGALSLGTTFPGHGRWTYLPLYHHLPGWDALRTPGRLMIWVTLGLCILAAGAVGRLARLLMAWYSRAASGWEALGAVRHDRSREAAAGHGVAFGSAREAGPWAAAVALLAVLVAPAVLVVMEGRGHVPNWHVATAPVPLHSLPQPVLVLPSAQVGDYHIMLWSAQGWPVIANGDSGFQPTSQTVLRAQAQSFPDAASVAALRARGIATVVIVRSRSAGTPFLAAADAPTAGLGISRVDLGDAVVYDLRSG